MRVPFNKPYVTGRELGYIDEAIANHHLSGDGPFTKKCHAWLQEHTGCQNALGVSLIVLGTVVAARG